MIICIRFILLCLGLLQLPQWRTISARHLLLGPQLRYVPGQTNPRVRQAQTDSEGVFSLPPCGMSGNRLGRERRLPAVSPSHGAHWLSGSPPVMARTWLSGSPPVMGLTGSRGLPQSWGSLALGVSPSHGAHVALGAAKGKEDFVLFRCAFPSPSSESHNLQIFLKFNNSL